MSLVIGGSDVETSMEVSAMITTPTTSSADALRPKRRRVSSVHSGVTTRRQWYAPNAERDQHEDELSEQPAAVVRRPKRVERRQPKKRGNHATQDNEDHAVHGGRMIGARQRRPGPRRVRRIHPAERGQAHADHDEKRADPGPGAEDVRHVRGDRERGVTQRGGVAGECFAHADEHGAERDDEPRARRSRRAEQTEKQRGQRRAPQSANRVPTACRVITVMTAATRRAGTGDELRLERDARDGGHGEQRDAPRTRPVECVEATSSEASSGSAASGRTASLKTAAPISSSNATNSAQRIGAGVDRGLRRGRSA